MTNVAQTVFAPAKLTVSLRITGIDERGLHLIDAEMVSLQLADVLIIDPSRDGLVISGPYSADRLGHDLNLSENLVTKALKLCQRTVHVSLTKNIPSGGGLGGGSADAAAILRWAGFTDLAAAAKIGSDIAFCLVGGRARVTGIGQIVVPLESIDQEFTLIIPPFGVSTSAVYHAFDHLTDFCTKPLNHSGTNDLELAAIFVEPRLAVWKQRITELTGTEPTLAGSGSTWWLNGRFENLATQLPDATVLITRTV